MIWTDLSSNFVYKTKNPINEKNLNTYLESLDRNDKLKAFEYIIKTPEQIQTQLRGKLNIDNQ